MKKLLKSNAFLIFGAIILGLISGYFSNPTIVGIAEVCSEIFVRALKLVSLPILFLSIISTISGIDGLKELRGLGVSVAKLTLITTLLASTVALFLFMGFSPGANLELGPIDASEVAEKSSNFSEHIVNIVPSNLVTAFSEGNVVGIVLITLVFSVASLSIPRESRETLNKFFSSLFLMMMQVAKYIIYLIPIALWSTIVILIKDLRSGSELQDVFLYVYTVLVANLVQGLIVLPLFLRWHNIPIKKFFLAMFPALLTAFLTKSSAAALPETLRCAQNNAKLSSKVSNFSFPLCGTINMNACAAFILITVLTVATGYGHQFSGMELAMWALLATVAAIGNAGVPMGCYFMASAYITSMGLPLHFMTLILPFYLLLDMLETAINVWSDSCVTAVIDKKYTLTEAEAKEMEPVKNAI